MQNKIVAHVSFLSGIVYNIALTKMNNEYFLQINDRLQISLLIGLRNMIKVGTVISYFNQH